MNDFATVLGIAVHWLALAIGYMILTGLAGLSVLLLIGHCADKRNPFANHPEVTAAREQAWRDAGLL